MFIKIREAWKKLGPGLVTGASDDDPSGIATYSQAGARFGLQTLWTAFITLPLMIATVEMFARLSLVTTRGLAENILRYFPRWVLYFVILITAPAMVLNIGADLAGMGAVSNLLFPQIPMSLFTCLFAVILGVCLLFFSYNKVASILKWLCLALFVYIFVPFLVEKDWEKVLLSSFIPQIQWEQEYFYMLVAILGTTISPYLFFWQGVMSLEHRDHRFLNQTVETEIQEARIDVSIGMAMSNIVMYFIILTCGSVLFPAGITHIDSADQAAAALKPLAGNNAALLFALGVIGTGLLSIPVLAGSLAYLLCETFGWDRGIDKHWHQARKFYVVICGSLLIGLVLSCLNINPIQFLIYTAVAYGLTCPILIALGLLMCNQKKILGKHTNGWLSNILGVLTLALTLLAAVGLLYIAF